MVNDVQMSDLVKLFAQNEENRVGKLHQFAKEVDVTQFESDQLIRIIRVINGLAVITVSPQPSVHQTLLFNKMQISNCA